MTVAELIAELQTLDPAALVVIWKDTDSSDYSPLAEVSAAGEFYRPESTWSGDVVSYTLTDEDRQRGYDEQDITSPAKGDLPCVVLVPVN